MLLKIFLESSIYLTNVERIFVPTLTGDKYVGRICSFEKPYIVENIIEMQTVFAKF